MTKTLEPGSETVNWLRRRKKSEYVSQLDGRNLPSELLTPIWPLSNALRYTEDAEPDLPWISRCEEEKLDVLANHVGWADHFRSNRDLCIYLFIANELMPGFPLTAMLKAKYREEDASTFKTAVLTWARQNLLGFTVAWSNRSAAGRPAKTPSDYLALVVDLYLVSTSGKLSVPRRCEKVAQQRSKRSTESEGVTVRTLRNQFAQISRAQLRRWATARRFSVIQRAAAAWALSTKPTHK